MEQVFSLLKASFGPQEDCFLQDYIELSLMLQLGWIIVNTVSVYSDMLVSMLHHEFVLEYLA